MTKERAKVGAGHVRFRATHDVSNKAAFSRDAAGCRNDAFLDGRMSVEHTDNLVQFNAITPDFHLVIYSSDELDLTVRKTSRQIPSLVETPASRPVERIE